MLQLYKNQVVTSVSKQQVDIRKLELDWYTNNYWTLSQQGALLAGFAFAQITTTLPKETSLFLETLYLVLACSALGLQMCVVVTTTFCCIWGPGLALRGPEGLRSVHAAVDSLKAEHAYVFAFFFLGLLSFYLSSVVLVWCYFEDWIAYAASLFLLGFLLLTLYYTVMLTGKLRVHPKEAVEGKIRALQLYENITDLDETLLQAAEAAHERVLPSVAAASATTPTSATRSTRPLAAGAAAAEDRTPTAAAVDFPPFFGPGEAAPRRSAGVEAATTGPAAAARRGYFGELPSSTTEYAEAAAGGAPAAVRERRELGGTALRPSFTPTEAALQELSEELFDEDLVVTRGTPQGFLSALGELFDF